MLVMHDAGEGKMDWGRWVADLSPFACAVGPVGGLMRRNLRTMVDVRRIEYAAHHRQNRWMRRAAIRLVASSDSLRRRLQVHFVMASVLMLRACIVAVG